VSLEGSFTLLPERNGEMLADNHALAEIYIISNYFSLDRFYSNSDQD